jgi:hypothetical protein
VAGRNRIKTLARTARDDNLRALGVKGCRQARTNTRPSSGNKDRSHSSPLLQWLRRRRYVAQ